MKPFSLQSLTEGIVQRDVRTERNRLVEKWSKTGLLRGLEGVYRQNMSQLLENQAAQVLREANALSTGGAAGTSSGQIQGFSNVAFPLVRRVFGSLVANELVSIQPMSLPSGLIFYLDYTYGSNVGGNAGLGLAAGATLDTYHRGQSIYGNPSGAAIRSGSLTAGGMYDLMGTGYSKVHASTTTLSGSGADVGAWNGATGQWVVGGTVGSLAAFSGTNALQVSYDSQVASALDAGVVDFTFAMIPVTAVVAVMPRADLLAGDQLALFAFSANNGAKEWGERFQAGKGVLNLRRHTKRGNWNGTLFQADALGGTHFLTVLGLTDGGTVPVLGATTTASTVVGDTMQVVTQDGVQTGAVLTVPSFESDFGSPSSPAIPEIDIKIESVAITATSRKLRARWSPELAQDLNAYHSLDAEVELTQVLSEQIALEIDREILLDLLTQANGANLYWSRAPGKFVNKNTGAQIQLSGSLGIGPNFTGTVREWYETFIETIIDAGNIIHRKTLRGSANFIVVGPDVATILEASIAYKPKMSLDNDGQVSNPMTIGCEAVGNLSNRFTVYKDPYFPRSKVLIGFRGGNFLETGYVYAPYVPLMVTPTIFSPEDFTPRRGVMTRYGKKMIRSDFYGTVTVLDMHII